MDNDLHNKSVADLLDGKELPITYNTITCQSNSVVGQAAINTTVVRSVCKLAATFITFGKANITGSRAEVHKEFHRFYQPMSRIAYSAAGNYEHDLDLEFQLHIPVRA